MYTPIGIAVVRIKVFIFNIFYSSVKLEQKYLASSNQSY